MKTKTGRLLMMQMKAKSNQSVPVDRQQNSETTNTQPYTPAKPQISSESLKQILTENQLNQQTFNQNHQYQAQLMNLRLQNTHLFKQVQTLKNQLYLSSSTHENMYSHHPKPQTFSQQTQTHQITHQASIQVQEHKLQDHKLKYLINSQQKPRPESKLKQKCSSLEVQNYRLIQNNYLLLLNMKKNLRLYKDSLTNILSKLQSLQFSQAAQEVYNILNNLKNQELTSSEFQNNLFPDKKEQPVIQKSKPPIEAIKPLKFIKLSLDSMVLNFSYYEERNIEEKQNEIQIRMKKIPHLPVTNQNPYSSRQSSSFHLINSRNPDPEFSHYSNNKLFNSQIRDHDYQISGLDKVSLQDKIESDWDHSGRKQPTIYKCHGNSTDLYKMLMLQAMAIQAFIA